MGMYDTFSFEKENGSFIGVQTKKYDKQLNDWCIGDRVCDENSIFALNHFIVEDLYKDDEWVACIVVDGVFVAKVEAKTSEEAESKGRDLLNSYIKNNSLKLTKEKLVETLKELKNTNGGIFGSEQYSHSYADDLLIEYIDDEEIKEAYEALSKWYE